MSTQRNKRYTTVISLGLAAALLAGCSSGAASTAAAPTEAPAPTEQPTPEPTAVPALTTITLQELRANCNLSTLLEKYGAVNYVTTYSDADGMPGLTTYAQYILQGDQFWGTRYTLDAEGNLVNATESDRAGDDLGTFYYYIPVDTADTAEDDTERDAENDFEIPEDWEDRVLLEEIDDSADDDEEFLAFSVCPADTFDAIVTLMDVSLPHESTAEPAEGEGEQEVDCGPQDDALILSTKEAAGDFVIERYYYVDPATGELLALNIMAFDEDGSLIGSSLTQYSYATPRSDDIAASGMVLVGEGEGCTVTVIANPGTEQEQTYTYNVHPNAALLAVDSTTYGLYSDAACTEEMFYTDLDGEAVTLYLAKKGE